MIAQAYMKTSPRNQSRKSKVRQKAPGVF